MPPRKRKDATEGAAGGPVRALGYPIRAFDEAGNEIVPQEIGWTVTGGRISFGDQAVPHNGRLVQGMFRGRVKGGKFIQVDSRWELVMSIAIEAGSVREIPEEEEEGTIQHAVAADEGNVRVMRAGRRRRKPADAPGTDAPPEEPVE